MGLNVTVRRLRFTLSAFTPPSWVGYAETQGGHYASGWRLPKAAPAGRVCPVSAAVVASHGAVARCTFHALGGAGVHVHVGGHVVHSSFRDLSGGAILLGGVDHRSPRRGMAARCNRVREPGAEYGGSVGIWGGYLIGASVLGNIVERTPYSAISLGWGWTWHPSCETARNPDAGMGCSRAAENTISRNLVRAPLLRMNDGGGIYTLGPQPRSIVRDNCILGADAADPSLGPESHQRHALYHDDGSSGFTSASNLMSEGSSVLLKPGRNQLERNRVLHCAQDGRYLPEEPGWCYAQYLTHAEVRLRKKGLGSAAASASACGFVPGEGLRCAAGAIQGGATKNKERRWEGTCVIAAPWLEAAPQLRPWTTMTANQTKVPRGGWEGALREMFAVARQRERAAAGGAAGCDLSTGCVNHTEAVCGGAAAGEGRARLQAAHHATRGRGRSRPTLQSRSRGGRAWPPEAPAVAVPARGWRRGGAGAGRVAGAGRAGAS